MPPGMGYPPAAPGAQPASNPSRSKAPAGPDMNGQIANGLANLTPDEMVALDAMLEGNPQLTALLMKAFPQQANDIRMFLKSVNSDGADAERMEGEAPQATPAGPAAGPPAGSGNPLNQITMR